MNLYAKERRGAKLIVTKKDVQQIRGELITVKPNSLLLLDAEGMDVSVSVEEIRIIRIVKKSKSREGSFYGLFFGIGGGLAVPLIVGMEGGTVMEQLPDWFEDYNENHPHKGLKMMSPREYKKLMDRVH